MCLPTTAVATPGARGHTPTPPQGPVVIRKPPSAGGYGAYDGASSRRQRGTRNGRPIPVPIPVHDDVEAAPGLGSERAQLLLQRREVAGGLPRVQPRVQHMLPLPGALGVPNRPVELAPGGVLLPQGHGRAQTAGCVAVEAQLQDFEGAMAMWLQQEFVCDVRPGAACMKSGGAAEAVLANGSDSRPLMHCNGFIKRNAFSTASHLELLSLGDLLFFHHYTRKAPEIP